MIDFQNAAFFALRAVSNHDFAHLLLPMMTPDEEILQSFRSIRDGVVFTNKRIITINIQGITGMKKDVTSLPYGKIQAFSAETAGILDLDSELEIWFAGMGKIKFEFTAHTDLMEICSFIAEKVL